MLTEDYLKFLSVKKKSNDLHYRMFEFNCSKTTRYDNSIRSKMPILLKYHNKQVYDALRRDAVRPEIGDKVLQCEYSIIFLIVFISPRLHILYSYKDIEENMFRD